MKKGLVEPLHWHVTETFYYFIKGRGVLRDIEGKTYELTPGTVLYASPGLAGSHEWDIAEDTQILAVRGSTEPEKSLIFQVDKSTKVSSVKPDWLAKRGITKFKKYICILVN